MGGPISSTQLNMLTNNPIRYENVSSPDAKVTENEKFTAIRRIPNEGR